MNSLLSMRERFRTGRSHNHGTRTSSQVLQTNDARENHPPNAESEASTIAGPDPQHSDNNYSKSGFSEHLEEKAAESDCSFPNSITQQVIPSSSLDGWINKHEMAASEDEFTEFFIKTALAEGSLIKKVASINPRICINLVESRGSALDPGIVYTQIGDFEAESRINPGGLYLPRATEPQIDVYVLFVCYWYPDHLTSCKRWIENVRIIAPRSPIVVLNCMDVHAEISLKDGRPIGTFTDICKLATVWAQVHRYNNAYMKVVTRCALLKHLEEYGKKVVLSAADHVNYGGTPHIPAYSFKSRKGFQDCDPITEADVRHHSDRKAV